MSVESWDPGGSDRRLGPEEVRRFVEAARQLSSPRFGLDTAAAGELAPLARHRRQGGADWVLAAEGLGEAELVALTRLFTLAESALSGWEAGDASPVIPLVRELKRRNAFTADLHAWIKANSDNRFLPYGNLMDRL